MTTTQAPSLELVREGLIELDIPADDITPDVSIRDDLDVDSTELVEIAVSLGHRCGVKVDAKSIKDVDTPAALVRRLEELQAQPAPAA